MRFWWAPKAPYSPQRVQADPVSLENWKAALVDMSPHVAFTGCQVLRSDFVDKTGTCPLGHSYAEHL
jgi:hypothetical protein